MNDSTTIKQALEEHRKWVASGGQIGNRLDFTNKNLSGANFEGADLSNCNLRSVDLQKSDLAYAKLHNANLTWNSLSQAGFIDKIMSGTSTGRSR